MTGTAIAHSCLTKKSSLIEEVWDYMKFLFKHGQDSQLGKKGLFTSETPHTLVKCMGFLCKNLQFSDLERMTDTVEFCLDIFERFLFLFLFLILIFNFC